MKKAMMILLLIVLTFMAASAVAAVLYVPSVYPTIQAAVTAASPGDEIIVAAGSYGEIVTINKAVALRSSAGAASTVLNGGITVSVNNVTIEGFTINDGASMGENAGIYIVASTSGHTISGNILNGPGKDYLPPHRGIVTGYNVSNMTVSDNTICDWTSGIYLNPGSNFTISGNTFCRNEAGIGSDGIDGVSILKNIFTSNDEGWGVSNAGTNVHANFNEFYGNTVNGVRNYCDMDPPLPADPCDPAESWVDATYNWWGDVCGPEAGGDTVEGNVIFDPWVTDATIYEDGEDGGILGWSVFDTTPVGATISNVADLDPGHSGTRVIRLSGSGTDNAYRLVNEDQTMWGNADQKVIEWKMKYSENFYVYVEVETTAGKRYLYYTPVDNNLLGNSTYVHHGLGADVKDGVWHTFSRDLEADLWDGQPSNNIEEVSGLYIRGTGRIDDVKLHSPATYLSIDDVPVDEGDGNATFTIIADPVSCLNITVNYRTGNGTAVAGEDYVSTKQSVTIPAGESFVQVDIPLIDDSDVEDTESFVVTLTNAINGRILDKSGTATIADNDVPPDQIVYEDAENGNISGWTVSDNVPGGAAVTNVLDSDPGHGGHVIQLWGSGTANAYELRCDGMTGQVGSPWNNTMHFMIEWSMKTLSDFYVFVDVDTTDGNRLLYYTPSNSNLLGTGLYVHHGLGMGVVDGQWHTFERDLLVDLREAQPSNNIEAVNGIYFRGNLWVDDIILKEGGPKLSISDASVSEDGGTAVFTITTSTTSPDPITVEYYTMDDTAVAPDDYDAIVLGTAMATIDPDETETQISVTINDDTTWEGFDPETFYVILSNPSFNAGIKDGLGVGSIVEDDPQPPTVYEDAEDGSASRWIVYDATPSGASITNVLDSDPVHGGTHVIEVSGYGTENAYLLTNGYGAPWHNTTQFVVDWNMKYSEFFYVFVEVETTNGLRYLYYTPVNGNQLGTKDYVHHGLTPAAMNGTWQHFSRNLRQDLKDAQPLNNIKEVNRFFIRGSGMVDDIALSLIP